MRPYATCRRCCCSRWSRTRSSTASRTVSRAARSASRRAATARCSRSWWRTRWTPTRPPGEARAWGWKTCGAGSRCSARARRSCPRRAPACASASRSRCRRWLRPGQRRRAMSEPLRILLVDDEAPARALLREYLGAEAGAEVVGESANGFEAVKAIAELSPDLVFLDVQMPKLDGFEVLELLEPRPAVIFCTAYDEYALQAFEVHAVDYLLKPFGRERLAAALARARERLALGAA